VRCASLLRFLVAATPLAFAACGLETSGLERANASSDAAPTATTTGPPPHADAASGAPHDASAAPPPPVDATTPPPPPPPDDAAAPADGSPVNAGCDQDMDGHAARGGCGGDDCCDTDARAYPGELAYYDGQDACGSFDYDCNGTDDPQYGQAGCKLDFLGGSCSGDGFDKVIACGASGSYTSCSYAVFSCNTSGSTRVQGCR
jgi:hypothetical protein